MESFPWTRVAGASPPAIAKPPVDYPSWTHLGPHGIRERLGDGNFAGRYQRSDEDMSAIWRVAVAEVRGAMDGGWD
jgi:creatinine amidohydrolase